MPGQLLSASPQWQQPSVTITHLPTHPDLGSSMPTPSQSHPRPGFEEQWELPGSSSAYHQQLLMDANLAPTRAPVIDACPSPMPWLSSANTLNVHEGLTLSSCLMVPVLTLAACSWYPALTSPCSATPEGAQSRTFNTPGISNLNTPQPRQAWPYQLRASEIATFHPSLLMDTGPTNTQSIAAFTMTESSRAYPPEA